MKQRVLIISMLLGLILTSSAVFSRSSMGLRLIKQVPASIPSQIDPKEYFNLPFGVAIKNGIAYVTDLGHMRIAKINAATMKYIGEIKIKPSRGIRKFLMGRIAFDKRGKLWITDMENGRILKINERTGRTLYQFGSLGTKPGQFNAPNGISFDSVGNLWVADELNSRVQKCKPSTGKCTVYSTGVASFPQDIAVQGNHVYVCLTWYSQIGKYRLSDFSQEKVFTGSATVKLNTPRGVAVDAQGNIAVSDNLNQRLVVLSPSGDVSRVITYPYNTFNTPQSFGGPTGIKFDGSGNLIVAQSNTHIVQKYGSNNVLSAHAGKIRNLPFQMNYPSALTVAQKKYILCDFYNYRIQVYDKKGVHKKTVGPFNLPKDVLYGKDGKIYVTDYDNTYLNGRIQVYDTNWQLLNTISFPYFYPLKLAMDKQKNLYATDYIMNKVYKISTQNYNLLGFYSDGTGKKFGIDVNPKTNQVYVTDSVLNKVIVLNSNLELVSSFGSAGADNGQFFTPSDISFNTRGQFYVTDSGNFRVQMFAKGNKWKASFGSLGLSAGHFFGVLVNKGFFEGVPGDLYSVSSYLNNMRVYRVQKGFVYRLLQRIRNRKNAFQKRVELFKRRVQRFKKMVKNRERNKKKLKATLLQLP